MKQLLLRVPEGLHRRLAVRAEREGRSINAIAGEILDASVDADIGSRQDRLRAAAAANGTLVSIEGGPRLSDAERKRILESTRGLGPYVDQAIDYERGPR